MFTGIITDIGRVRAVRPAVGGQDARFEIETRYDTAAIASGASICCSGACLTVVAKGPGWFAVDVSQETLEKTNLGDWRDGQPVNLEQALRLGDELGGHIVSGHVDGTARIVDRRPEGGSLRFVIELDHELGRFIAPKGSVAIDGISLTVNEVIDQAPGATRFGVNTPGATRFGVNIIPHTQDKTTLGAARPGQRVNVEVDMLARYVARLKASP